LTTKPNSDAVKPWKKNGKVIGAYIDGETYTLDQLPYYEDDYSFWTSILGVDVPSEVKAQKDASAKRYQPVPGGGRSTSSGSASQSVNLPYNVFM